MQRCPKCGYGGTDRPTLYWILALGIFQLSLTTFLVLTGRATHSTLGYRLLEVAGWGLCLYGVVKWRLAIRKRIHERHENAELVTPEAVEGHLERS